MTFHAFNGVVTLKRGEVGGALELVGAIPRLQRRGHIEARVARSAVPAFSGIPRLQRRGHIEAICREG